ncbi:MAG: RHS repeat-associated core domain-containing protein, partial [Gammaproteobacteria bacterium]
MVAGTGAFGFSGDGGPASEARLSNPFGVATDRMGNLYIADQGNSRIRKITSDGIIRTVVGGGSSRFPDGDGGPATQATIGGPGSIAVDSAGNIYLNGQLDMMMRKVTATDGIIRQFPVIRAGLIVVDPSDNLFIYGGHLVQSLRKVDANGSGEQVLFPSLYLSSINGIAADRSGSLYLSSENRILKATPDGALKTIAGELAPGF